MITFLSKLLHDKKTAILGFGREGQTTYRLLRSLFPGKRITIIDQREDLCNEAVLSADPNVDLITGKDILLQLKGFDFLIKAPGFPGKLLPASVDPSVITSQTSLFLQFYADRVIGVTGTKGKSTTASLIHSILQHSGFHSLLVGNIGLPPFEAIPEITGDSLIVMELSSHQLEFLKRSPHISILLNIFQEHLDHYLSYEHYQKAKFNIATFQEKGDYYIYAADNPILQAFASQQPNGQQKCIPFSFTSTPGDCIFREESDILLRMDGTEHRIADLSLGYRLPGDHNLLNIMAAAAACTLAGAPLKQISEAVSTFSGLEHRIEFVGEYRGILFYNDSIATIPEATMQAVKTLQKVDTLILGGYDRGIEYSALYPFLKNSEVRNFIMIGEAGKRMMREMESMSIQLPFVYMADNYEEVVTIASGVTARGKICLLSPAASSYDMFKNFEHRGNIYKKNVRNLAMSSQE